jgi:hypothetical protein
VIWSDWFGEGSVHLVIDRRNLFTGTRLFNYGPSCDLEQVRPHFLKLSLLLIQAGLLCLYPPVLLEEMGENLSK